MRTGPIRALALCIRYGEITSQKIAVNLNIDIPIAYDYLKYLNNKKLIKSYPIKNEKSCLYKPTELGKTLVKEIYDAINDPL